MSPEEITKEKGGVKAFKDALKTTIFLLKLTMVVLVIAFACSGMKYLEQYEKAVVLRFGAESGSVREEAGLHFAMPFPIDQVIVVPTGRTQSVTSKTFMYQRNIQNEVTPHLVPGVDGYLLTADANILHCEVTLKYSVDSVSKYAFSVKKESRKLFLTSLMDAAVLKVTSKLTLEQALDKKDLIAESKSILQKSFDDLELGVVVELMEIKISVPRQVEASRQEVTKATQYASFVRSEADTYERNSLNDAESRAAQIRSKAEIWKSSMISRINADFKTFTQLLDKYRKDPEQVKSMLLQSTMVEVIPNLEGIYIFNKNENRELRLNLQRKPQKKEGPNDGDE